MMVDEYNNRLMNILLDNIDYTEYNLNEDDKKWIYMFTKESPETFNNLDIDLQSITEDRYIKIENIPTIIKIITDIYYLGISKIKTLKSFKNFNMNHHLFIFITYTIIVILDSEILILHSNVKKEDLYNIIDSSMALLNMNLKISSNENHDFYDNDSRNQKKYCGCVNSLRGILQNYNFCYKRT
jgi:hypothetical protein